MLSYCVIGAGQLGSRHMQGFARLEHAANIYFIDPSIESINLALSRFNEANLYQNKKIFALSSCNQLPKKIDFLIIATNSDVRLNVLRELSGISIGYMLLEKVLFPFLNEYVCAKKIIDNRRIPTWVNCSQRMWPFFEGLRKSYYNDPKLTIEVRGSNWGLGCNAIHNIDIATFLWPEKKTIIAKLSNQIIESKRPGFSEISGEIITNVSGGGSVIQASYSNGDLPLEFIVRHPDFELNWNLSEGFCSRLNKVDGYTVLKEPMIPPFQSELTARFVNEIISTGNSVLPSFYESIQDHIVMLKAMFEALGIDMNKNSKKCIKLT